MTETFSIVEYNKKKKDDKKILKAVVEYEHVLSIGDYNQFLASRKPIKLVNDRYYATPDSGNIIRYIPPLNTDIRVSSVLPSSNLRLSVLRVSQIPTEWNWEDKGNILKPLNQYLCGSCWAMAAASVLSDCFAVLKGKNPHLSPAFILSCYGQGKCNGGNPAQAISDMKSRGCSNTNCIDYQWCSKNDNCNGAGTGHFDADPESLNKSVPYPACSCYTKGPHTLYYPEDPESLTASSDTEVEAVINKAKEHMMQHGPIIGTYHVLNNFLAGNFGATKDIYIDKYDYGVSNPMEHKGDHAIRIIGWGEDQVENEGLVKYWLCMNSWGDKWGKGGKFKIAMYPTNRVSQFERSSKSQAGDDLGGMVLVKAGTIKDQQLEQTTNVEGADPPAIDDDPPSPAKEKPKMKKWLKILLITLAVAIVIILAIRLLKGRRY